MDELLVVSFSRSRPRAARAGPRATGQCPRGLADPATIPPDDRVLRHLAYADPPSRRTRRRLEEALTVFDAATVTTTHGFCQQVLLALGIAGDHDPGAVLVENVDDLVAEVADDLYLRKWAAPDAEPQMSRGDFRSAAPPRRRTRPPTGCPTRRVAGLPPSAPARPAVRAEVDRRKRRQQLIGYDDMLIRLAGTLAGPDSGPVARERLRTRYRIVLVDEFQDTDPVQWRSCARRSTRTGPSS